MSKKALILSILLFTALLALFTGFPEVNRVNFKEFASSFFTNVKSSLNNSNNSAFINNRSLPPRIAVLEVFKPAEKYYQAKNVKVQVTGYIQDPSSVNGYRAIWTNEQLSTSNGKLEIQGQADLYELSSAERYSELELLMLSLIHI